MFATAGCFALAVTQSTPASTESLGVTVVPQGCTRTATIFALGATPKVLPATVPATWVPCPQASLASGSLSTKSQPDVARPSNSSWVSRTPVSSTYAVTPAPPSACRVASPSSGRSRWLMRSRPQLGTAEGVLGVAASVRIERTVSIEATSGSAAMRFARVGSIRAENPRIVAW